MVPKISIIVPVFNVEHYLEKCIESILSQTLEEFELILVNDGSSDRSGLICDYYRKRDTRIIVIHKENGGQSSARNVGIKLARGEYVGFVDSDDWIDSEMFRVLYDATIRDKSDIVISGIREINEKGNIIDEYVPFTITFSDILKRAYPCNKLFRRKLFNDNNFFFFEGRYYEDLELVPKLFIKSKKVTIINKAFYNYLKRTGSTTGSRDEKILDNLWAYVQLKQYLIVENLYELYKLEFEKGTSYFKRYFINIIYDYPSKFIISNLMTIIKEFNHLGGLGIRNYYKLLIMHISYLFRKAGYISKNKIRELFT